MQPHCRVRSSLIGVFTLKGGRVVLMSPHCLESQGCSICLFFCYSAYSCCSFCLLPFSAFGSVYCLLSRNFFKLFSSSRDRLFCIALGFSWVVLAATVVSVACYFDSYKESKNDLTPQPMLQVWPRAWGFFTQQAVFPRPMQHGAHILTAHVGITTHCTVNIISVLILENGIIFCCVC